MCRKKLIETIAIKEKLTLVYGSNLKNNETKYEVIYLMENGHNPRNINDIKYAMFIFWKRIGKKAVVIGQNPSKAYNNYALDGTNQNIVKILKKKGYSGYLMLNTFPKIDPNGKSISNITKNKKT